MQATQAERRWNRSSWIALTVALALFVILALPIIATWSVPTDGWAYNSPNETTWRSEWTLTGNLAQIPSDLRPGDVLLAVDGQTLPELYSQALPFWRQRAPNWPDGHILHYTIRRGNTVMTVAVPIRRLSPLEQIRYGLSTAVGGIVDPIAALTQVLLAWSVLGISLLVFVLKPRDLAAYALLLMGVGFFFSPYYYVGSPVLLFYPSTSPAILRAINGWESGIGPGLLYLILTFPRPVAFVRRAPSLALVLSVVVQHLDNIALTLAYSNNVTAFNDISTVTTIVIWMVVLLIAVVKFSYAAWTLRGPVERAQMKWLAFGLVMLGVGGSAYSMAGQSNTGFNLPIELIQNGSQLLFPISLGIAITRFRLFDIDLIIRRTLIYSVLTAILAVFYFVSVSLMQSLLSGIIGKSSDVAVILSTLAIAALFMPVRQRVQSVIDRRFYRRKYDAQKVLAQFGATARDQVELDQLTAELLAVVGDTMQPAQTSLWLKQTQARLPHGEKD